VTRVALFVAGLAGAFLAAFVVGRVLDVGERTVPDAHAAEAVHATALPGGLSLEQDGYRLEAERDEFVAGHTEAFVFHILAPGGEVLRDYDVDHEKRLHLIVVSRPLVRFLHLHPRPRPDGAWTVPLTLPENASYRAFADFTTGGERRTLGIDLQAYGRSRLADDRASEYDVLVDQHGDELDLTVSIAGKPVELQRYLGARGHLVVLREGDLAYIHAHADKARLSFDVPFPSHGEYRLFLQFKVDGKVETGSFGVTR